MKIISKNEYGAWYHAFFEMDRTKMALRAIMPFPEWMECYIDPQTDVDQLVKAIRTRFFGWFHCEYDVLEDRGVTKSYKWLEGDFFFYAQGLVGYPLDTTTQDIVRHSLKLGDSMNWTYSGCPKSNFSTRPNVNVLRCNPVGTYCESCFQMDYLEKKESE